MATYQEQKILRLIADEQKYDEYISKKCKEHTVNEVVVIPANSFLAQALKNTSISEISQILNTQFIGLIPANFHCFGGTQFQQNVKHLLNIKRSSYTLKVTHNEELLIYGQKHSSELPLLNIKEKYNGKSFPNLRLRDIGEKINLEEYHKLVKHNRNALTGNTTISTIPGNQIFKRYPSRMLSNKKYASTSMKSVKNYRHKTILFHVHKYGGTKNDSKAKIQHDQSKPTALGSINIKRDCIQNQFSIRAPIPMSDTDSHSLRDEQKIISNFQSRVQPEAEHRVDKIVYSTCEENNIDCQLNHIRTDKMLVLLVETTKSLTEQSKQSFSCCRPLMGKMKWKEFFIRSYSNSTCKTSLLFISNKNCKSVDDIFKETLFEQNNVFLINVNIGIKSLRIINGTICVERIITSNLDEINKDRTILYFFRPSNNFQLQALYDFISLGIRSKNEIAPYTIALPEHKISLTLTYNKLVYDCLEYLSKARKNISKVQICERGYLECSSPLQMFINVLLLETTAADERAFNPTSYQEGLFVQNDLFSTKLLSYQDVKQFQSNLGKSKEHCTFFLKPIKRDKTTDVTILDVKSEFMGQPINVEGYAHISNERYLSNVVDRFDYSYKEMYILIIGSILFLTAPEQECIPNSLKSEQILKKKSNTKNSNDLENLEILSLDNKNHIPWLNNDCKISHFMRNDYSYFKEYKRRLSLVLRSSYCIDIRNINSIELSIPHLTYNNEKYYKRIREQLKKYWNTEEEKRNVVPTLIMLTTRDNSTVNILLPTRKIAEYWIIKLRQIIKFYEVQSVSNLEKNISNKKLNSNVNTVERNYTQSFTENSYENVHYSDRYRFGNAQLKCPYSILLNYGVLHQKTGIYHLYTKYFVLLIPGTLVLYKIEWRDIKLHKGGNIMYKLYRVIPLNSCYIYRGNSPSRELLPNENSNYSCKNGRSSYKLYGNRVRNDEDRYIRSFTIQYGKVVKAKENFINKENFSQVDIVTEEVVKNQSLRTPLNRFKGRSMFYQSIAEKGRYYFLNKQIFLASCKKERDIWYTLISREIDRVQQ